ncbi:ABC transporter substrate-binding protein [Promicromonospora thailandica]|uniref:Peptide/nickel transport system substrate-binding protein n=1 Tax=Promicromonospora thailandica TaxID=765201 RepID=A0A9X2G6Z7_9MICO|nr:ABC transporter substrate-binding protein [Promicromonospora thailandica]MCP2266780.1 peptide/nickel transport system substrate-binding protein [Promicromonospora thailandica]BFF21945.1 ABC transporter substrate-binding protein [Promicromonospora thailandica]
MRRRATRLAGGVTLVTALAVALSGCVASERDADGGEGGGSDGTFVFAGSAEPSSLDPAFASDGETFRVARQIFEGLVGVEPGTADPAPLLAESWDISEDGLTYTFNLKEGVTFHDDTPFDAEAVCANFDRWHDWTGLAAHENLSYYYKAVFGGTGEDSLYDSCEASDAATAVVTLNTPIPELIPALSLPSFSMQSPAALEEFGADEVEGTADAPQLTEYGREHPTGTGPYTFQEWKSGESVTLAANENYWGEIGDVKTIVFTVISDGTARRQALEAGDIDGYDLVAPADVDALKEAGYTILDRDAFNILYLGMNQAAKPLDDVRVRQAIAHAIDKDALVQAALPEGTTPATQFVPEIVTGYSDDVTTYEYDPEKAKDLLKEAGQENLELEFNYPTEVSRPYMPDPAAIYEAVSADLEEVGITVTATPEPWSPTYIDTIQGGENHGLHLLGWTGDYNDTYNFIGTFFGAKSLEWGFDDQEVFDAIKDARNAPLEEQEAAYMNANEVIMDALPGVPLASPVPSLVVAPGVEGYPISPVQDEVYNVISLGGGE